MVEEKFCQNSSQRKRGYERDACINNLKLNVKFSSIKKDYIKWSTNRTNSKERIQTNICNKATIRGSLDNVSKIPLDNQSISTLRRTQSLAISRENLFYSLNYTEESTKENRRRRRAQLIPRAKLIEKSFSRDSRYESLQVENTRYSQKQIQNKPEEIPPDYSPLPKNIFSAKFPQKNKDQIYDLPPIYNTRNNTPESNFTEIKKTHHTKKSLESLTGLSLPHYYPDSEVTDNISITGDNLSTISCDKFKSYTSLDNFNNNNNNWGPESIPYDENIVLARKPENNKPRTIRAPHPKFDYKNLPQFNTKNKIQHLVDEISSPSSLEFETNTNWDEIKLNNEHITKVKSENDTTSIIIVQKEEEKLIELSKSKKKLSYWSNTERKPVKVEDQNFKTVVTVNDSLQHEENTKSHSHNYLKEFLETQKGSKKPLQSFIAKKFLNLTRKQQSTTKSNLVTNQFYSLPDINVSKNLHKCEKIDQKLRKCVVKAPVSSDRFIVNIGSHLDITGNNIPLDFELKIAKVPKKSKKQQHAAKEFEEAVKSVNTTLQTNGFSVDLNNNNNNNNLAEINEKMMDPEIQEKLGSMRNYWTKITGNEEITMTSEKEPSSLENSSAPCKIIEMKKKFEPQPVEMEKSPNKIQLAKQLFEPKVQQEKVSPIIKETCNYFEKSSTNINNRQTNNNNCYESLGSTAIDLVTNQAESEKSNNNNKNNLNNIPEFDHVRYKVIKPELFNKKILANCKNQEEFDGLMQYLKDYSFQELLIDNNIVIIEPIRSKVPHNTSRKPSAKNNKNGIKSSSSSSSQKDEIDDVKQSLRKHFFYHPIRVNKEVNDDELPNPEVVRQARQFFEKSLKNDRKIIKEKNQHQHHHQTDTNHHDDPDKDKCTSTSSHSTLSLSEDTDRDDDEEYQIYDSLDNECCRTTEYVSEDILEKIREYGTTITYYGGRVVDQNYGQPVLTKLIMEEIKMNEKRCMVDCNGCRRKSVDKTLSEVNNEYQGIKFKLVKSNSCNSRLELVGAAARKKNIKNKKNNNDRVNNNNNNNNISIKESNDDDDDSTVVENNIRLINNNSNDQYQPKIIGEEKKIITDNPNSKYVQWSEIKNNKSNNNHNNDNIKNYDYREKIKNRLPINDMEFEPYEVA